MAANISLPSLQGHLLKTHFLGKTHSLGKTHFSNRPYKPQSAQYQKPCAKFNLFEAMGGRGLCNGEEGLQQELTKKVEEQAPPPVTVKEEEKSSSLALSTTESVPEDGFGLEKELMGLTGGFPGGEKGLELFIQKNPPPPEKPLVAGSDSENVTQFSDSASQLPKDSQQISK